MHTALANIYIFIQRTKAIKSLTILQVRQLAFLRKLKENLNKSNYVATAALLLLLVLLLRQLLHSYYEQYLDPHLAQTSEDQP